jgi:uncharacterized protein YeaO (DUF488 family)
MKSSRKTRAAKAGAPGSGHSKDEIRLRRVYDPQPVDGSVRFLVDRLWPRGIKKSALTNTEWLPDVAPSPALRKWFGHDASRWAGFRRRYRAELENNPDPWKTLAAKAAEGDITLLFGARDMDHNQAVVLKEFLEEKLA